MQAIIDGCRSGYIDANPAVVISNNSASGALERARRAGIPCFHISSKQFSAEEALGIAIADTLENHGVDLVILAGYMKIVGPEILRRFRGRVLNIHPALLPKFGGKGMYGRFVHEAVLAAGEKESGPTVHLVDEIYDHGRILAQAIIPVLQGDTPDTLADRVLQQEHILYPDTIRRIALGEIIL